MCLTIVVYGINMFGDAMGDLDPRLFNLCRRSGASRLYSLRDGGTLYFSDWSGVIWHEENVEIEDVMETPEVGPADLLLLSVNTIHATQMTDDRRLAVSLRTCDPETPIDWHRMAGSPTPRKMQYLGGMNGRDPNKLVSRFSTHPGKQLQHHVGGHRAEPDRRARVAEPSAVPTTVPTVRLPGSLYLHL